MTITFLHFYSLQETNKQSFIEVQPTKLLVQFSQSFWFQTVELLSQIEWLEGLWPDQQKNECVFFLRVDSSRNGPAAMVNVVSVHDTLFP